MKIRGLGILTKNRYLIPTLLIMVMSGGTFAQTNQYFIRNYGHSLILKIEKQFEWDKKEEKIDLKFEKEKLSVEDKKESFKPIVLPVFYSGYGQKLLEKRGEAATSGYLFSAHEYEQNLNLLLYPFRIYSAVEKRFLQPDPKSQYFSPYLFVAADPINNIDFDGNIGRPLVLFQEEHSRSSNLNKSMKDLMESIPDAHYVPMSDFVNGKVGDLPEWNGNVFLKGHTFPEEGEELLVEMSKKAKRLKTLGSNLKYYKAQDGLLESRMDAGHMGRLLRQFSESRGVPVRNIMSGGCDGIIAAKRVGIGYKEAGGQFMNQELNVYGLKEGYQAMIQGRRSTSGEYYEGLKTARFHAIHETEHEFDYVEEVDGGAELKYIEGARINGYHKSGDPIYGPKKPLPFVENEELGGLLDARIAKHMTGVFDKFTLPY